MKQYKKFIALSVSAIMLAGLCSCTEKGEDTEITESTVNMQVQQTEQTVGSDKDNTEREFAENGMPGAVMAALVQKNLTEK